MAISSARDVIVYQRPPLAAVAEDKQVVAGDVPQEPAGFRSRTDLLALLDAPLPQGRVAVVHAVTGMRGVGKTHLAAAYARGRLDAGWRVVAWVNAEDTGSLLSGLTTVAVALGLPARNMDVGDQVIPSSEGLTIKYFPTPIA